LGINDSGEVVGLTSNGLYGTPAEVGHGFSVNMNGTNYVSFDVPGSVDTQAEGINNLGMIVGVASSTNRATWQGFLKNGSTYTSINVPGAVSTWANGINDAGEIVGDYSDGTHSYGFLETGGTYTTFNVPGATDTYVQGINDSGLIVGYFDDAAGRYGFLATSVPEPASLTLAAIGGLVIAAYAWRCRR